MAWDGRLKNKYGQPQALREPVAAMEGHYPGPMRASAGFFQWEPKEGFPGRIRGPATYPAEKLRALCLPQRCRCSALLRAANLAAWQALPGAGSHSILALLLRRRQRP